MKTFAKRNHNAQPSVQDLLRSLESIDLQQLNTMTKDDVWNTPFLSNVPDYPISLENANDITIYNTTISAVDPKDEPPKAKYAPEYFPPLPPLHTYKKTINTAKQELPTNLIERALANLNEP